MGGVETQNRQQEIGDGQAVVYEQSFAVPFTYTVAFTHGLFASENRLFVETLSSREPEKCHRCLFFIDEGVLKADPELATKIKTYVARHAESIDLVTDPLSVVGGEKIKSELTYIEAAQDAIHAHGIDRHSYVIAIGGGAVLDAIGLAATTCHRGVRHIRVPTTVLSQNDSGVGVKNAVNLKGIKNFIGTFAPPWAVLNDFDFLEALPPRERISGIAEAVKVALIRDRTFFEWLETNVDDLATFKPVAGQYMIKRCAELHMKQIARGGDPFEMGSARPLDFGHWSAHKLEALTRHHVRHGEAVAIGIALDSRYSVLKGLLPEGEDIRIVTLLENLSFRVWHPALQNKDASGSPAIMTGLKEFQEHLGGELTITFLNEVGVGVEVHEIDHALMQEAASWLRTREGA